MLLFGHIWITLGMGMAGLGAYNQISNINKAASGKQIANSQKLIVNPKSLWLMAVCAVGAILPDIIDKPVGHLLFSGTFHSNGRIFSHTLLFALVVLGIGLAFHFSKRSIIGLVVTYGVFMHLSMWQTPQTLLWPLMGWGFPGCEDIAITNWLSGMLKELVSDPSVYFTELIGFLFTLWLGLMIIRTRKKMRSTIDHSSVNKCG